MASGTTPTSPTHPPVRRYGFNCPYCQSRLEASSATAGRSGQCPTCSSTITVPSLGRGGRLVDAETGEVVRQDPHPVHAYAAAGSNAPQIERLGDGTQRIRCPRCGAVSAVTSDHCVACALPFTMEGTSLTPDEAAGALATASLALGILGLPMFCTVVVPLAAVVLGVLALWRAKASARDASAGTGRGMAAAGIICGVLGLVLACVLLLGM